VIVDVLDPQVLEVQGPRAAVHADVGDVSRPAGSSSVASSNVAGTPTASMATSAPRPPVIAMTSASSAAVVDDDVGAELLGRLEPAVGEVDGDDVARAVQRAPMIADRPIGPAPTTATTSPGLTRPLSTPTS
jgi:hypothetical protein